ncbi:hypothetical protein [Phenylobacterium sp. 58.2.17]|uniref:hypothetical protein n=1 Tax=Phenylobacterium sp. 58.2.17 TaxID=2969306 RepID=UPI002263AF1D|nr:hypothetical protein [Phenylobacterium sp. 58.2.17]MCX7586228.1 hypothetical protein [Phenylobacterium sp. 58.2.17]
MDASQTRTIVARDLLAAVGEVMLRWGYLESAMLKALDGSTRTPVVQRWLAVAEPDAELVDGIKDAAAIRHLLAHGLCEIQARPRRGGEAEVVCRDPADALVRITFGRLREVALNLDRLRLHIDAANRA